jgi:hypothetical protein
MVKPFSGVSEVKSKILSSLSLALCCLLLPGCVHAVAGMPYEASGMLEPVPDPMFSPEAQPPGGGEAELTCEDYQVMWTVTLELYNSRVAHYNQCRFNYEYSRDLAEILFDTWHYMSEHHGDQSSEANHAWTNFVNVRNQRDYWEVMMNTASDACHQTHMALAQIKGKMLALDCDPLPSMPPHWINNY